MANHIGRKKTKRSSTVKTEKQSDWPSWRYNPETGQGAIFEDEDDVPEGWLEHARSEDIAGLYTGKARLKGDEPEGEDEEPEELEEFDDVTVTKLRKRLDAREVSYQKSADKQTLYDLLKDNY